MYLQCLFEWLAKIICVHQALNSNPYLFRQIISQDREGFHLENTGATFYLAHKHCKYHLRKFVTEL